MQQSRLEALKLTGEEAWRYDLVPWILYERVDVDKGMWPKNQRYEAFGRCIGYSGVTPQITNMCEPFQLPQPMYMRIDNVYCLYEPDTPLIFKDLLWELQIGQKVYAKGPMSFIATPGSLPDKVRILEENKPEIHSMATGWPTIDHAGVAVVPTGQQFKLNLNGFVYPDRSMSMWFCLEGVLARGVQ